MAEWQKKFDTILVEDDFKPVVVQSRAEWDALVRVQRCGFLWFWLPCLQTH
jgi:hypothetical protein